MKQFLITFIKKNRIVLGIILFFLIWMLFFDEYNMIRMRRDNLKLKSFKEESIYLKKKIEEDRMQLDKLQNNMEELERFAREEYLLKKDNEEVYIIIEE